MKKQSSITSINAIQQAIKQAEELIGGKVEHYNKISANELVDYFEDDAPSGDITTIEDILGNKWLLIHELIELSELKGLDLKISSKLLVTHAKEVDYAHITATEYELKFAQENKDEKWIKSRLIDINSWSNDDDMPQDLKSRCRKLLKIYS